MNRTVTQAPQRPKSTAPTVPSAGLIRFGKRSREPFGPASTGVALNASAMTAAIALFPIAPPSPGAPKAGGSCLPPAPTPPHVRCPPAVASYAVRVPRDGTMLKASFPPTSLCSGCRSARGSCHQGAFKVGDRPGPQRTHTSSSPPVRLSPRGDHCPCGQSCYAQRTRTKRPFVRRGPPFRENCSLG